MAKNQTTQRMINTPQTTLAANPWQSSVIWGNGVVNNGVTVKVPPSISNPASLNPTTTPPKTTGQTPAPVFSDNMTKPAYTTPATTTPAPTVPAKGTVPVPAPAPTTPPLTGVDKVNAETRARVEAERNAQLLPPTATEWAPEGWDMKTGIFDKGNYLGMNITEDEFFTLPFEQQQALIDQAALDVNQKQWMQDQVNLAADITHQKEYATELNDINTQISGLNKENADINSARTVKNAQKDFDTLQQNLGFLGTGGRPVKSTASMNSMARQLVDAQALVNDIKRLEANKQTMMKLGMEFDSKQFEEQIFQINQKMKKEIDASILLAIQGFTSEQMRGYLDTPQKMFEAQNRYLNSVDNSVTGITNRTVQQLKARQDFYAKQAETNMKLLEEDRKTKETMRQEQVQADIEFKKQANTVNEKLSLQTGVLTDWNGEVMVDKKTGIPIAYDPFAAEKPTVTADGKVVTFSVDPVTGKTVASFQELWKKPQELQILGYDDNWKAVYGTFENWVATPVNVNGSTNSSNDPASNPTTLNISNPQTLNQIIDFCTTKRGTDSVQCGMLVNDYIMKVTGTNPSGASRFQDSLQSKITAIDNIGRAAWPVAGGLFAYPTNDPAGHTGIVTKVNADGSIEVLEANVKGSAAGWPPKVSTYPASKYKSWTFSQAPAGQKEAEQGVNTAGDALKNIPWAKPTTSTNLSPLGNEALKSGTITGTPTQKGKIVDELAKAGVFDEGLGNSNYYLAGQPVKDWLKAVTEWYDKRQQARDIYNRMKDNGSLDWATWPIDKWLNKAVGLVVWNSSDYNNLNAILQKELSTYMNKISGATVSEPEVNRLKDQIPNLSMNDSQFKDAMEQYNQSMKNGINYAQTQYWFDGIDNMRTKLIGGGSKTTSKNLSGGTNRLANK